MINSKDKEHVKKWVKDHDEEIHELYHLTIQKEIEVVKIVYGNQEITEDGKITLHTLELHFLKDLVLVEKVVEVQAPTSYVSRKTSIQLGYLSIPSCDVDCDCLKPIMAKEIN